MTRTLHRTATALSSLLLLVTATTAGAQEPPPDVPPPADTAAPPDSPPPTKEETPAPPPPEVPPEPEAPPWQLEVYGFVMTDMGYDFKRVDPAWFDVLRVTKIPSAEGAFGDDGVTYASVRQTRFGVKGALDTDMGQLKTQFEWELFGVGVDAGQTTIRLRHAYGELGNFGAGQYWSPFMDIDVFPNSVEYWGPPGMAFFRNVQARWMPIMGEHSRVTIAIERPGASADRGEFADRTELEGVVGHFPAPDVSAEARLGGDWGYIEGAGILRYIEWDDTNDDGIDISGNVLGWGVSGSSNLRLGRFLVKLQVVYGHGIQNYMNDAPADVGAEATGDPLAPLDGVALACLGIVGFVDFNWTDHFASTAGYSYINVENTDNATPDAFHAGHYALANIIYMPVPQVMTAVEFQWGRRENNDDGFTGDDYRIQVSWKYSFSKTFGP